MPSDEKRKLQIRKKYTDELLALYKQDMLSLESMEDLLSEVAASVIDVNIDTTSNDSKSTSIKVS